MAFENLFIRTNKNLAGIQLDAVLSESHDNIIRVSKNPVELGADITDHAIIEPKRINLLAQVSDTPLGLAAGSEIIDSVTGLFGTSTEGNITRSNAAYNSLIQLMELREPIEVQTKLVLYSNMLISRIRTIQDKDSSRAVLLNIDLEEILITESEIVQLTSEQLSGVTFEQGASSESSGRKEPVTPSNSVETSVLKTTADWIREL